MKIIFYSPTSDAALWLHDLVHALPDAEVREWQPGDHAPADYAIVWRPPHEMLAGRDTLRAVFNLGAGVDAILAIEAREPGTLPRNVPLVRLEDSGMARQMAEYAMHAVLRYLRRFDEYALLQNERNWEMLEPHPRETFTVGVLGLGLLGTHVAERVATLGVPVRGYSRNARSIEGVTTFAGPAQFDAFLDGVKVLINLLPYTPDTHDVLNASVFAKLAHGAYVVNLARGRHLVDKDLLAALDSGQIAGAMLDVFREEPLDREHPFWRHPRIAITPHSAALTLRAESIEQIGRKIHALENGETIGGIVDLTRGY